MAWQFVQSVSATVMGQTSLGATFGSTVSAGNKIIVAASVDTSTRNFVGVSDGTTSWTNLAVTTIVNQVSVGLWALDVPAGDVGTKPTLTVTSDSASSSLAILVMEYSGLLAGNTSAMLDGTIGTVNAFSSTPTAPTYASAVVNELLLEVIGDWGAAQTFTAPGGFTADANSVNASGIGNILAARANSTGGTESDTYTVSGNTAWGQILVAFKVAAVTALPFRSPRVNQAVTRAGFGN